MLCIGINSNEEDKIVLIHFLNSLKLKFGNLTPKIIICLTVQSSTIIMLLGLKYLRVYLY